MPDVNVSGTGQLGAVWARASELPPPMAGRRRANRKAEVPLVAATAIFIEFITTSTRRFDQHMCLKTTFVRTPILLLGLLSLFRVAAAKAQAVDPSSLKDPREVHLENVRQLTFSGENAEAYFSADGARLIFQSRAEGEGCDQIYTLDLATGETRLVSTGEGRTTCSYYYPGGDRILYASTHHWDPVCPPPPDMSQGYVWALYPTYDIFAADPDGSNRSQLTESWGYDAEATFSPVEDLIVFTSMRDGDLEIYTMRGDGSEVKRLTHKLGYDGGPFFSPDGTKIVYRAGYPKTEAEAADYRRLLAQGLIRPSALEIYVMDADGSNQIQVTDNGAANFGPYFHPSGEKVLFSSNLGDPTGREFDIYMVDVDGTGLEQVTFTGGFDGFPMFSPDGKYLVFGSNRNESHPGNTNVFIAEWVESPGSE
jgi:Tol biopolymer transport system component